MRERARNALRLAAVALLAGAGGCNLRLPQARESWLRVETPNFTLFGNAPEGVVRDTGLRLERFRAVVAQVMDFLEVNAPVPTFVYVFRDEDSFRLYRNAVDANVAGFFTQGIEANYVALLAGQGKEADGRAYHEFIHYMLDTNDPHVPLWFNEGLAEFYSTFEDEGSGTVLVGSPIGDHIAWLRANRLIPLHNLLAMTTNSPDYHEGGRQGVFYAESWALTHYVLLGNPTRKGQAADFMNDVAKGQPTDEAFRAAFQADYGTIEHELQAYVRCDEMTALRLVPAAHDAVITRVTPMRRGDVLYCLGDLLLHVRAHEDAKAHIAAALAADPDHARAHAAMGVLLDAERRGDDARAHYESALTLAPDDFLPPFLYGNSLLAAAAKQGAASPEELTRIRDLFKQSARLQPGFAESYVGFGETFLLDSTDGPGGIAALEKARQLLPARPDVALNLANLYFRHGRTDSAGALIDETCGDIRHPVDPKRCDKLRRMLEKAAPDADHPRAVDTRWL